MRHVFVQRALGATLVVLVTACTNGSTQAESGAAAAADGLPAIYSSGAITNVTFYYTGTVPLTSDNVENLKTEIGRPAIVVTTPKTNEADAAATIHALGTNTKAYRYINLYWAPPSEGSHEGVELTPDRKDWAFCQKTASGVSRAVVGRETGAEREPWYFLDLNETTVSRAIRRQLVSLQGAGYDGVMFDRGLAATQSARDINGNKLFAQKSTCTADPVSGRATLSDAYVRMLGVAKSVGLSVMMNNGRSPFDPTIKMRPDPRNAACRAWKWSKCRFIGDVWRYADLVLNESPAHPRGEDWARDFGANQRSERDSAHGHRTVALITTDTLGGEAQQTPSNVYYQWSRIKLFNLAVAVNTGTGDGCDGGTTSGVCNRFGVYPELASVKFGRPLKAGPAKQACIGNSAQACIWTRTYARGVNVLNQTGNTKRVTIALGRRVCDGVTKVRNGDTVAGSTCVKQVRLSLPPWSGTPLKYS